jgi:hypothetical protein
MDIGLGTIRSLFDAAANGTMSRKDVSDRARRLREADDCEQLTIALEDERDRIWQANLFLEVIDL